MFQFLEDIFTDLRRVYESCTYYVNESCPIKLCYYPEFCNRSWPIIDIKISCDLHNVQYYVVDRSALNPTRTVNFRIGIFGSTKNRTVIGIKNCTTSY